MLVYDCAAHSPQLHGCRATCWLPDTLPTTLHGIDNATALCVTLTTLRRTSESESCSSEHNLLLIGTMTNPVPAKMPVIRAQVAMFSRCVGPPLAASQPEVAAPSSSKGTCSHHVSNTHGAQKAHFVRVAPIARKPGAQHMIECMYVSHEWHLYCSCALERPLEMPPAMLRVALCICERFASSNRD